MKPSELAKILTGREYGREITEEEEIIAKDNGMVVVFGYSDDNMEFRGALNNEYGCYGGGDIVFLKNGNEITEEHQEQIDELEEELGIKIPIQKNTIFASYYPWKYKTSIPHETFDVFEDGELSCVGLVFYVNDLI